MIVNLLGLGLAMQSHGQIQMVIDGEQNEKRLIPTKQPFNHKVLRNAYKMQHMTPLERKIWDFQEKIRRERLRSGDKLIKKLRKKLDRVKVFRPLDYVKKKREQSNYMMVKYQPGKVATLQREIDKKAQKAHYGKSLKELMKTNEKSNPFKGIVELQSIIDDAEKPIIEEKKQEEKEMQELLNKKGMKSVIGGVIGERKKQI